MIRVVIIDDEEKARSAIRSIIKHNPKLIIVGEAESIKSGIEELMRRSPDLVFLDINMGDGTGFDLLNQLPVINFRVIFVTAHESYAIQAFKYSALDYILKPIDPIELMSAVEKASEVLSGDKLPQQLNAFLDHYHKKQDANRKIVLKTADKISLVALDEIIRCESDKNYTIFYLSAGQRIVVSRTLKDYDELLSEQGFLRIHQSHLINLKHLTGFEKKDGGYVIMSDNSTVSVSFRKKDQLLVILEEMGIK